MRKVSLLGAVVLATSLVIGVSLASAISKPETLRFFDVEESFLPFDPELNEDGPPPVGARFSFTDGLYQWAGKKRGNRAGRLEGTCTFTRVNVAAEAATVSCVAMAYLPRGRILLAGFIRFAEEGPGKFVVPVIGGTGRYDNARGTATFRELPSGNTAAVLRLVP